VASVNRAINDRPAHTAGRRLLSVVQAATNTEQFESVIICTVYLARRVVHGEIGCSKWKKTLAYLLVLPGSRARIVRCGGRYDPQLVKRSSECE